MLQRGRRSRRLADRVSRRLPAVLRLRVAPVLRHSKRKDSPQDSGLQLLGGVPRHQAQVDQVQFYHEGMIAFDILYVMMPTCFIVCQNSH